MTSAAPQPSQSLRGVRWGGGGGLYLWMVLLSGGSKGLGSWHPQETFWTDKRIPRRGSGHRYHRSIPRGVGESSVKVTLVDQGEEIWAHISPAAQLTIPPHRTPEATQQGFGPG